MSQCWNNKLCSNWVHQVHPTKKCHYKQIWNELKKHGKTLGFKNLIINNACKVTFPMLWFLIVLLQAITSIKRWTKMQQHTYGKGSLYVYCNKYKFPFLPRPIMIHQLHTLPRGMFPQENSSVVPMPTYIHCSAPNTSYLIEHYNSYCISIHASNMCHISLMP
jgi:hypothetical protein